jgi:transposase
MEKRKRRKYTQEFKVQAVELSEQLGSFKDAAEKLGISDDSIRLWKRDFEKSSDGTKSISQLASESEEIKRLKKQIINLEKTNYILKKAAAFFSQDHLK